MRQRFSPQGMRQLFFWCLIVILAFAFYGGRSLRETSEARYGEVAREMLVSGNWLLPHLHGNPHLTKPPLAYWLMAGGMKVAGVNEWGARLALPLAFLIIIASIYSMARSMRFSQDEASCAALLFATSGFSFLGSFVLTSDPFLTAAAAAGIAAYWRHRSTGSPIARLAFWALFGIAFLIKGPPAWLHLMPVAILFWARPPVSSKFSLRVIPGSILMVTIGCSWFLWMIIKDPSLLNYYLNDELIARVATDTHGRDISPLIYAAVLILGIFPWVFLLPGLFWKLRSSLKSNGGVKGALRTAADWQLFCLLWIIAPLIVFVLAKSRMPLYVLPLFLPICLVLGKQLPAYLEKLQQATRRRQLLVIGFSTCWLVFLLAARAIPDSIDADRAYRLEAQQLLPSVAPLSTDRHFYWILGRPIHGLAFYLNRTVENRGLSHLRDIQNFSALQPHNSDNLYVVRQRDLSKLLDAGGAFEIVARSPRIVIISGIRFPDQPRTPLIP